MDEAEKTNQEWLKSENLRPGVVDLVVGPGQDDDNRRFGELLSSARENAGRSRAEVAAELDLSNEYLRLIELGKRTPALGQMERFLEAYRAIGEVGKLQPGGDRPDLRIFDIPNKKVVVVEFQSRIREARQSSARSLKKKSGLKRSSAPSSPVNDPPAEDYATDLGLVVRLLSRVEHAALVKVRNFLLQSEMADSSEHDEYHSESLWPIREKQKENSPSSVNTNE